MRALYPSLAMYGRRRQEPVTGKRRRRPEVERCEDRTLLSALRIGSLGDSLTDEYQFYAPDRTAAQNWVEILSQSRSGEVDFGAFTTTDRGETRNQGYAQNWARSGAQAQGPDVSGAGTTFVEQYMGGFTPGAPGLITQAGGLTNVDVVTILIGGNDFVNALEQGVLHPVNNSPAEAILINLNNAKNGIVTGVQSAITAIQTASPGKPIVLAVTPNVTDTVIFQDLTSILPATDRALLDAFIDQLINDIGTSFKQLEGPTVAVIDPNEIFSRFTQQGDLIEGLFINPTVGGPVVTDLFVGDQFHPGTIAQGLLANGFMEAFAGLFPNEDLTPLSDAEIVALAQAYQPVTQASLSASSSNPLPGEAVTFTLQVATFPPFYSAFNQGTFPVPTGTVTFVDAAAGNRLLGVITLDLQGTARLQTVLGEGAHQIVASYSGNTVYPGTTPSAAPIIVGTPQQAALISLIQTYQERLGRQVKPPLLARWTTWLDHGIRPETIARTIYHRVGAQPLPRSRVPAVPVQPIGWTRQGVRARRLMR